MQINAISPIGFLGKSKSEEKLDKIDHVLDKFEQNDSFEKMIADDEVIDGFSKAVTKMSASDNKPLSKLGNALMVATIGIGTGIVSYKAGKGITRKSINILGKKGEALIEKATQGLNYVKNGINGIKADTKATRALKNTASKIEEFAQKSTSRNTELGNYANKLGKSVQELTADEIAKFDSKILGEQVTKNLITSVTGGAIGTGVGIKTTVNVAKDENKDGIPDKFQQTLKDASGLIIGV